MSLFDDIVKKREWQYLWELKVSNEEYNSLKKLLEKCTHSPSNPFMGYERECALFFAEYWRREYDGGEHSKVMVYTALNSTSGYEWDKEFYEAARKGAEEQLGLEMQKGDKDNTRYLDSLLYQGGLPMIRLFSGEENSVWNKFAIGLINKKIDFKDLNLGKVAKRSQCLIEYCNKIISSLEKDDPEIMPFNTGNLEWFKQLQVLATQERRRQREQNPFSLFYKFTINEKDKNFKIRWCFEGSQIISDKFLESYEIKESDFILQVRVNGENRESFDYRSGRCSFQVRGGDTYHQNDRISLYIGERLILDDDLDMTIQRLLYEIGPEQYIMGNKIGQARSVLIVPEDWGIVDCSDSARVAEGYLWKGSNSNAGNTYTLISIPENFVDEIKIKNPDGDLTISAETAFYWTELSSMPLYKPYINEAVYDVAKCKFKLCYDSEGATVKEGSKGIQFRNKWQKEWSESPSYGVIFARCTVEEKGMVNLANQTQLINVGKSEDLSIEVVKADEIACKIRVRWVHGDVSTKGVGIKKDDDIWEFKKEDCSSNQICFNFSPSENGNDFNLHIKAPFKSFEITDNFNKPLQSGSVIPLEDINNCRYRIIRYDVVKYKYGDREQRIKWNDDALLLSKKINNKDKLPFEGRLSELFGSTWELKELLNYTSENIENATIEVSFSISGKDKLEFAIKECPYRIECSSDKITVDAQGQSFNETLKLFKLYNPEERRELNYVSDDGYVLPKDVLDWGNTLVTGSTMGRVLPVVVDLSRDFDADKIMSNKEEGFGHISDKHLSAELRRSNLTDPIWQIVLKWFEISQKEGISASALPHLASISTSKEALYSFAFMVFLECKDEIDLEGLIEQLKALSDQLSFKWFWLSKESFDDSFVTKSMGSPENESFWKRIYINWAFKKDHDKINKLLSDDWLLTLLKDCKSELLKSFIELLDRLRIESLLNINIEDVSDENIKGMAEDIVNNKAKFNQSKPDYVNFNQKKIHIAYFHEFFDKYRRKGPNISENDQWLYSRVRAVYEHLKGNIDLFEQREEIRRSIIFSHLKSRKNFILELNNLLVKTKLDIK